ncbi:unnamed protein product [Echinostoma caproni]|uniref:Mitochondrial ribosomal protein L3 n=1 Tax=Echinostoma caproni TaxID=27848 RepID=A0A183A0S4_9TREM|nr:unnamed protein product [Echinostoma caproni]
MFRLLRTCGLRTVSLLSQPHAWSSNDAAAAVSHSLTSEHLWRSFFYVPGNKEKMFQKIAQLPSKLSPTEFGSHIPDLIVLDCEDAVGLDEKVCPRVFSSLTCYLGNFSGAVLPTKLKNTGLIK